MARIRSLKPEFWDDRKLARSVSRDARMLYMGLWNQCDEHARCQGDPVWIKGRVFPYDEDIDAKSIDCLLAELADATRIVRYEVDGDPYLFLPKLAPHQRLDAEKVPSRLPAPPEKSQSKPESEPRPDESAPSPDQGADKSEPGTDVSVLSYVAGSRGQVAGGKRSGAKRATRLPDDWQPSEALLDWGRERFPHVNGRLETEKFVNYWTSKSGKDATKTNWEAVWRNWIIKAAEGWTPTGPRSEGVDWDAALARAQAREGGV